MVVGWEYGTRRIGICSKKIKGERMVIKKQPAYVFVLCHNCETKHIGYPDENGLVKMHCKKCGATTHYKVLGRRHIRLDVYAPAGQELLGLQDSYNSIN